LILGAYTADPNGKLDAGKSYVVFGKANGSVVNLSAIADANNPTGGFVINGAPGTHNQIIQAIAVDIACTGD
jgi:Neuraminidase (sialidase)